MEELLIKAVTAAGGAAIPTAVYVISVRRRLDELIEQVKKINGSVRRNELDIIVLKERQRERREN